MAPHTINAALASTVLTPKKYRVILADPPWKWKAWSKKGLGRSAAAHYRTLDLSVLTDMGPQVRELADDDCVLFMWRLNSMEVEAHELIKAWGFTYKTVGFTWNKQTKNDRGDNFGLGFWTHQSTEEVMIGFKGDALEDVALALDMPEQQDLLLATKGHPRRISKKLRQVIYAPIREHSRKPDKLYGLIESFVQGPYVELFSRARQPGWDVRISNQAGLLDKKEIVSTRRLPSSLKGVPLEQIEGLLDGSLVLAGNGKTILPVTLAVPERIPEPIKSTPEPVAFEPDPEPEPTSEPTPDPALPELVPTPESTPEPVESTTRSTPIVTLIPKTEGVTRFLYRDYETQSRVDVRKVGARNYVAHLSTKVFCCAYALNDSPVQVWWPGDPIPPEFGPANHDAKVGHNSDQFDARVEREILGPQLGWPQADVPEYDTMILGARIGLPQKLSMLAVALNLEVRKDADGRRLMLESAARPGADAGGTRGAGGLCGHRRDRDPGIVSEALALEQDRHGHRARGLSAFEQDQRHWVLRRPRARAGRVARGRARRRQPRPRDCATDALRGDDGQSA
jgi:N6-adenosine-specific RNA methylase IME4